MVRKTRKLGGGPINKAGMMFGKQLMTKAAQGALKQSQPLAQTAFKMAPAAFSTQAATQAATWTKENPYMSPSNETFLNAVNYTHKGLTGKNLNIRRKISKVGSDLGSAFNNFNEYYNSQSNHVPGTASAHRKIMAGLLAGSAYGMYDLRQKGINKSQKNKKTHENTFQGGRKYRKVHTRKLKKRSN